MKGFVAHQFVPGDSESGLQGGDRVLLAANGIEAPSKEKQAFRAQGGIAVLGGARRRGAEKIEALVQSTLRDQAMAEVVHLRDLVALPASLVVLGERFPH